MHDVSKCCSCLQALCHPPTLRFFFRFVDLVLLSAMLSILYNSMHTSLYNALLLYAIVAYLAM